MTNWGTYTFPLDLAHQHVTSNKDDAHWCVLLHGTWYPASKLGLGSFNNLKWKQAFRNNCLRYLHLRICKCLYSVYPRWKYWKKGDIYCIATCLCFVVTNCHVQAESNLHIPSCNRGVQERVWAVRRNLRFADGVWESRDPEMKEIGPKL